ncbi:MAG TPA: hypothetical protein VKF41_02735 [Bryobacteraceae bacterium]|nr:hypothetical protein [Bryobacteraceae bacterium]
MWIGLLSNPAVRAVALALAGALLATGAVLAYRAWRRSRIPPEERERRRREMLAARGKMADAELAEIRDDVLFYSYGVRGVEYTASQDVTMLQEYLPHDYSEVGPVSVKYDPRNPANSILVAERWSGLRARKAG